MSHDQKNIPKREKILQNVKKNQIQTLKTKNELNILSRGQLNMF